MSTPVVRAHEERAGRRERDRHSFQRHAPGGIGRLCQSDALPDERLGHRGLVREAGVGGVSVGNQGTDTLIESAQHVGED